MPAIVSAVVLVSLDELPETLRLRSVAPAETLRRTLPTAVQQRLDCFGLAWINSTTSLGTFPEMPIRLLRYVHQENHGL